MSAGLPAFFSEQFGRAGTKVSLFFNEAFRHAELTNAGLAVECVAREVPGQVNKPRQV
jgi:hypothetical protein